MLSRAGREVECGRVCSRVGLACPTILAWLHFPGILLTSRLSDVTEMTHSGYVWSRKVVYECNYYVYTPRSRGDVRGRVKAT